jgi:uncharacterized protein (DUF934 family)
MTLWKNGAFVAETWRFPAADEPLGDGPVAVGRDRFLAEREALVARNADLGLVLQSGEGLEGLEDDVHRFCLIVLVIPRYTDGRNYSTAAILRERFGYTGEIRATGDVLRDQIPLMLRCGIDALEVVNEPTRRALEEGKVRGVSVHYQPTAAGRDEAVPAGTRPWLRVGGGRGA